MENPKSASKKRRTMTTDAGIPVADNENSLTAGPRGPVLMADHELIEKMAHFNRERVPERVVHAKGAGAYGTFKVTHALSEFTRAKLFQKAGNSCEVFVRFSTVAGEQGSPDTVRDPRGFAVKFYTEEGNWDLVGNNTPIFFIRDPLKFSDFIHSQKREPRTGIRSPTMQWDFWSLSPESLHQVTILFSDRGIPATYRNMNGYASHTFALWNAKGERFWVKWHLKTLQGIKCLTDEQAARIAAENPDFHRQDLFDSIERKEFPRWSMQVQIMPEKEAETYHLNPFDLTKVWPHKDYPLREVGILELNRNPENFFEEVEQSAFEPSNLIPGMGASPDKMLQARLFSYADAHRYRIGVNYNSLPVNRPKAMVNSYNRDGSMRSDGNGGRSPNYEPNSFGGPSGDMSLKEPPLHISGDADRYDHRVGNDDYTQAGDLFRLLSKEERGRLVGNIARAMKGAPKEVLLRELVHFYRADPEYGLGIARLVGLEKELEASAPMKTK